MTRRLAAALLATLTAATASLTSVTSEASEAASASGHVSRTAPAAAPAGPLDAQHRPRSLVEPPPPPPPDLSQLPDGTPTALPGVQPPDSCAAAGSPPDPAQLNQLLWANRMFRLPELWRAGRARGVRIAVLDTGVSRHPLLAGRLIDGGDFVAGKTGLADCEGHGTAVAGIAASAVDPTTGFSGIAPNAEIISIRQTSELFRIGTSPDAESAGDLVTLAAAVVRAVELDADVINISEVACAPPNAGGSAALRAAIRYAVQRDIVVVAAAGNLDSGEDGCSAGPARDMVIYPGWFDDDVLTVASVGPGGIASAFSYPGPWVDVAAPGENLVSLASRGGGVTDVLPGENGYVPLHGTSFAAPAVAGLAALIRAKYPELSARQVIDRIVATAHGSAGRGGALGYGVVDPMAALTRKPEVLSPPAPDSRAGTGVLPLAEPPKQASVHHAALWGALLALLTAGFAGVIALGKQRPGRRHLGEPRSGQPRSGRPSSEVRTVSRRP